MDIIFFLQNCFLPFQVLDFIFIIGFEQPPNIIFTILYKHKNVIYSSLDAVSNLSLI